MPLPKLPAQQEYICACFYRRNIFVEKYKMHVVFETEKQFEEQYRQHLRMKGCATERQYSEVLAEIQKEIARRKSFHELSQTNYNYNQQKYARLHPSLWNLQPSFLDPRFLTLVKDAEQVSSDKFLISLVEKGGYIAESNVYRFPVFSAEFCHQLIEEIKNFENFPGPKSRPNTMHSSGISLDEMGMSDELVMTLVRDYLQPITKQLFPEWGGGSIDSFKAFIVNYGEEGDKDLATHYDNAEVTISIGLNSGYKGGDLQFGNLWGEENRDGQLMTLIGHETGHGILHCGRQLHSALATTAGQRYNLVIWMRSSKVRNNMCPMCGESPMLTAVPFAGEGFTASATETTSWNCRCF